MSTPTPPPIILFTDFGVAGPYVGALKLAIAAIAPTVPVIDLMHDAPLCDPRRAGVVLAALLPSIPPGAVGVAVVDPGVGTARLPVLLSGGGRRFVGPQNGLLDPLAARLPDARWARIDWHPATLSASFHGRDLFAPVAARLAVGLDVPTRPLPAPSVPAPEIMPEIVYVDVYGNLWTGWPAASVPAGAVFVLNGQRFTRARTFADRDPGTGFWYENSAGLVEIAVREGSAARHYGAGPGTPVEMLTTPMI